MILKLIFLALAAVCNSIMDKLMIKYLNLPDNKRMDYYGWFSFDPMAKWKNRVWSKEKAYNIFLLKINIKTTWLSTNCNDAWHFFKSLMVIFLALSMSNNVYEFIGVGIVWNLVFNYSFSSKHLFAWIYKKYL